MEQGGHLLGGSVGWLISFGKVGVSGLDGADRGLPFVGKHLLDLLIDTL